MDELCSQHREAVEYYCEQCNRLLCKQCQKTVEGHGGGHTMVRVQDKMKEILSDTSVNRLRMMMDAKAEEKKQSLSVFEETLDKPYVAKMEQMEKHLRDIIDILSFRAIDLKKELNSYHNDNRQLLDNLMSKQEFDLEQMGKLSNIINQARGNGNVSEKEKYEAFQLYMETKKVESNEEAVKKVVMERPHDMNHPMMRLNSWLLASGLEQQFTTYSLPNYMGERIEDSVMALSLIKDRVYSPTSHSMNHQFIYRYGDAGMERIDLKNKNKTTMVLPSHKVTDGPDATESFFHQNSVYNGVVYIFIDGRYFILDTKVEQPTWVRGQCKVKFTQLSTCFDYNDNIYILGGFQSSKRDMELTPNIYKFNITSRETTLVCPLKYPSRFVNSQYIESNGKSYLYLISGFGVNMEANNVIDIVDLDTRTITTRYNLEDVDLMEVRAGTYVEEKGSFYVYQDAKNGLSKFSMETGKSEFFKNPLTPIHPTFYIKLFFNGLDTIYLMGRESKNLLLFNIYTQTWSIKENVFSSPLNYCNFVSFANS